MNGVAIENSLLRVDNFAGNLPELFERPNESLDVWVLELPSCEAHDFVAWQTRVAQILVPLTSLFADLMNSGATLTLFVQTSSANAVVRLESSFLQLLSDRQISFEYFCSLAEGA